MNPNKLRKVDLPTPQIQSVPKHERLSPKWWTKTNIPWNSHLEFDSIDTRNSHLPKHRWKVKINKDPFEKNKPSPNKRWRVEFKERGILLFDHSCSVIQRLGWKGPTDLKREDWGPYLPFISDIFTVQNGRHLKAWWFTICHTPTLPKLKTGWAPIFFASFGPGGWGQLERTKRWAWNVYVWGCRWEMFFFNLPS